MPCYPRVPMPWSAPSGVSQLPAGPHSATATDADRSTPGSGPSTWRSPSSARAPYFPEWLLERRKRSESALITVVADCFLAGVSTRRMDRLVKTLGIDGLSKSQVSRMAADLDSIVEDFRHRPWAMPGHSPPSPPTRSR